MPSEPTWSKKISSTTVCTWFYILAVLDGIVAAFAIFLALFLMLKGKSSLLNMIMLVMASLVGFTNSWFLFLVCNRGLKA